MRLKPRASKSSEFENISMNYKNLNYEIETEAMPANSDISGLTMNYKNLNYEIETGYGYAKG